jgi:aerobic C4-dicarboxylate transport protein
MKSLYLQVLIGIALGSLLGVLKPTWGSALQPVGEAFINCIKLLIGPIIFTTLVSGISGMGDLKRMGRVGGKALLYFEVVTTLALGLGLVVANVFTPGAGIQTNTEQITAAQTQKLESYQTTARQQSTVGFILHIIPKTFVSAFTEGELLQVLFVALLSGVALAGLGEKGKPIQEAIHLLADWFFRMVTLVSKAAPVAAFAAMAYTLGTYGAGSLAQLGMLLACVYLTCIAFIGLVLGGICRWHGFSLWKILRLIKEELLMVLGTSSSEVALPSLMKKLENTGCSSSVVGIVLPAGYSFNLDGTSIYLTLAAIFLAQATNTPLSLAEQLGLLGILMLTSKGAAAVTGGGFITLAATLSTVGSIPATSLALIFGIDRFMSEARAITNLIGNTVATLVVSKWEGALDLTSSSSIQLTSQGPSMNKR